MSAAAPAQRVPPEAMLALAVLGVLAILIVPLPAPLLDGLLALNIAISVMMLLVSLGLQKAMDFSVFPSLLLDRITVAEQTGNLAPGLRDVARSYRAQLDRWLGALANTFSTVVLVAAFALVGLIAFAIVSAVFSVGFRL